jgi:hypothetical protein
MRERGDRGDGSQICALRSLQERFRVLTSWLSTLEAHSRIPDIVTLSSGAETRRSLVFLSLFSSKQGMGCIRPSSSTDQAR